MKQLLDYELHYRITALVIKIQSNYIIKQCL